MAFTEKYILICDDVRAEPNGKLIVIGLYQDNMLVPQIPFSLPSLSFLVVTEVSQPGEFTFKAKFANLEVGKAIAQAIGGMKVERPGRAVTVLQFRNVQIDRTGSYQFSLTIDEEAAPFTTTINVMLAVTQPLAQR